jgi:hypothetical protein
MDFNSVVKQQQRPELLLFGQQHTHSFSNAAGGDGFQRLMLYAAAARLMIRTFQASGEK